MKKKGEYSASVSTHLCLSALGEAKLSQIRKDLALESDRPVFTSQLNCVLALRCALSVKKR